MPRRKNPHAVALGRLGGKAAAGKGARLAAERMTPEQLRERARTAALARWAKRDKDSGRKVTKKSRTRER